MMSKAKSCIGGFSLFNYVIDEKKGFELIRNNVCGETALEIFQEFKILQDQNQRATNKLFSLVLSPQISDGERLSRKEFREIVKDYLDDLEFDIEQEQFIAFCHVEKRHRHIHILLNRVSKKADLKKDSFIGKKAQWSAHRVAQKHGLVSAKQLRIDKIINAEKIPDVKSVKLSILVKHRFVIDALPMSFKNYIIMMGSMGVSFIPTINKQGLLQGYRVRDQDTQEEFKASDIHKSMSLKNLLEAGLPLVDDIEVHPNLIESQRIAKRKIINLQAELIRKSEDDLKLKREAKIEEHYQQKTHFRR